MVATDPAVAAASAAMESDRERKGLHRLAVGAGLGIAGGLFALVLPIAFLLLAKYNPGGFFTFGTTLIEVITFLVFAGAFLFLLSLFSYRLGFGALRKVDARYSTAAGLCILGSLGFLLLLVAAGLLLGSGNSLVACLQGRPTHLLSCLRSGQPLGAYTGLVGFWLGWLGGVGLVLGLSFTGGRYHHSSFYGAAALYALLLLALVGPFVALITPVPDVQYLLFVAPFLTLFAPAFVFAGSRSARPLVRTA
ncbi:MAG: hypothetical protein L3K15_06090 [Thermoplasmata archaeon]|nr:hypothetical protein [Thermoplasmata archaeon]